MELLASIQIGYLDQDYEVDSDESGVERKKMLSLQRKAFIHESLSANESFRSCPFNFLPLHSHTIMQMYDEIPTFYKFLNQSKS